MKHLTLAAVFSIVPFFATADTLTLTSAMAGGTVHGETVDVSAYTTEGQDGRIEVTAFYAAHGGDARPSRVVLELGNGDQVRFGLPDLPGDMFGFARRGETVTIWSESTVLRTASN